MGKRQRQRNRVNQPKVRKTAGRQHWTPANMDYPEAMPGEEQWIYRPPAPAFMKGMHRDDARGPADYQIGGWVVVDPGSIIGHFSYTMDTWVAEEYGHGVSRAEQEGVPCSSLEDGMAIVERLAAETVARWQRELFDGDVIGDIQGPAMPQYDPNQPQLFTAGQLTANVYSDENPYLQDPNFEPAPTGTGDDTEDQAPMGTTVAPDSTEPVSQMGVTTSTRKVALSADEIRARVDEIGENLDQEYFNDPSSMHPTVIDSCMENARDLGYGEDADPDAFWGEVYSQLLSEIDAQGYDNTGRLRPEFRTGSKTAGVAWQQGTERVQTYDDLSEDVVVWTATVGDYSLTIALNAVFGDYLWFVIGAGSGQDVADGQASTLDEAKAAAEAAIPTEVQGQEQMDFAASLMTADAWPLRCMACGHSANVAWRSIEAAMVTTGMACPRCASEDIDVEIEPAVTRWTDATRHGALASHRQAAVVNLDDTPIAGIIESLQDQGRDIYIRGWSTDGLYCLVVDNTTGNVSVASAYSANGIGRWECSVDHLSTFSDLYAQRFPVRGGTITTEATRRHATEWPEGTPFAVLPETPSPEEVDAELTTYDRVIPLGPRPTDDPKTIEAKRQLVRAAQIDSVTRTVLRQNPQLPKAEARRLARTTVDTYLAPRSSSKPLDSLSDQALLDLATKGTSWIPSLKAEIEALDRRPSQSEAREEARRRNLISSSKTAGIMDWYEVITLWPGDEAPMMEYQTPDLAQAVQAAKDFMEKGHAGSDRPINVYVKNRGSGDIFWKNGVPNPDARFAGRKVRAMGETLTTCDKCGQSFYYDPKNHRCPGEWEDIAGPVSEDPYAGMTWVEEQMAKQNGPRPERGGR